MHVANGQQYFTDIEHSYIIAKAAIFTQPIKKFSSRTKLKDHVNKNFILKGGLKWVDKGMVELC